ncbi:MAG: hypothetical protein GXO58_04705 [Thermodesulfobacteria bacterium]|nr:hypothetical protein [Thermodesulfobacteriota bacterium]
MSIIEIQKYGFEILTQNLGVIGMLKFIQQFDRGHGDYTKERSKWLDNPTIEEIENEIRQLHAKHSKSHKK